MGSLPVIYIYKYIIIIITIFSFISTDKGWQDSTGGVKTVHHKLTTGREIGREIVEKYTTKLSSRVKKHIVTSKTPL